MALTHPEKTRDVAWLVKAAELMLRPMARLLVGKLSCNVAIQLLRETYVHEARRHLRLTAPDKRITKSALALLTGLDTRVISALDGEEEKTMIAPGDVCPEAAVLDAWAREETYQDPETSRPRVLPIYGRGISFQTLVTRAAGRNVTCTTVLDRLTESGNLQRVDENYVMLVSPHYLPVKPSERTVIEAGSASVNRLGRTVAHNMSTDPDVPRWLQQDRWSTRIPEEKVEELRSRLRNLVTQQILEVEKELDAVEAPVQKDNHMSVGFGWFYWESPDQSEQNYPGK